MKKLTFITGMMVMFVMYSAFATTDSSGNGTINASETSPTCYGDPLKYLNSEKKSGTITYSAQWEACPPCNTAHASCELSVVDNECTYITTSCDTGYGNMQNSETPEASCSPNVYSINYEMNGGTNYIDAPTNYTYAVGATIDGVPTKTNAVFAGWCTDSGLTSCAMTQIILPTDTEYKTFYAKWSDCAACNPGTHCTCEFAGVVNGECTYTTGAEDGYFVISGNNSNAPQCTGNTIHLNWNGGDGGTMPNPNSNTCMYGESIDIPETLPTREGYKFIGWKVTSWTE